ncbi:MAG: gluconate 2-dehydrogenase subunit 3 family protein [Gemmatimonadetes bacterium]|nr:gluconate 2-dehydrogenase subunit 3 family protein [Gemmatimonadota bacterium]
MNRRDVLRVLGGAATVPLFAGLSPGELRARGITTHARARGRALQVLDPHQSETVATIAELILPETDTPGARAAKVHEFVDVLLAEWYDDKDRGRFLAGLADVDTRCRGAFGVDFLGASEAQRTAILAGLDAEVAALRAAHAKPDDHFFSRMKWLTLYGYYTSEVGMMEELRWQVIPGTYDGCVERQQPAPGGF